MDDSEDGCTGKVFLVNHIHLSWTNIHYLISNNGNNKVFTFSRGPIIATGCLGPRFRARFGAVDDEVKASKM